jgi:ABC-type bacteriocin/lantibiotic exporter with double-glycine peptidase domain
MRGVKKQTDAERIIRFVKLLRPYLLPSIFVSLGMTLNVLLTFPLPLLTMYLIDDVLVKGDYVQLSYISIGLVVLILVQSFLSFATAYFSLKLSERIFLDLKTMLLRHVQNMSMAYFNRHPSGYIVSRITDDVSSSQSLLFNTFTKIFLNLIKLSVGTVILFYLHVNLTIVSLLIIPFFVISLKLFNKKIRKLGEERKELFARNKSVLQELILGMRLIKSYVRENIQVSKYRRTYKRVVNKNLDFQKTKMLSGLLTGFIASLGPIIVLVYGGSEVLTGNLTIGQLIAFSSFLGYIYGPVQSLMSINVAVQSSLGAVKRIFDILDSPVEVKEKSKSCPDFKNGEIAFNKVTFAYNKNQDVLKDINLKIPARSSVALVGPSGSGKTTMVEMISRFYDPNEGSIKIDGYDLTKVSLPCVREQVAEVTQNTFMFKGTIKQNITFGKLNATDEEIVEAAKVAYAHDFIMMMPKQYETKVGERGVGLSGGQLQRIALARAVVRHHPVLILDEATSALDVESDYYIQKALKEIMKHSTTIIIAHRLSTIHHVDQIVVMDKGRMVQRGNHQSLYKKKSGLYRKLHDLMERENKDRQVEIAY